MIFEVRVRGVHSKNTVAVSNNTFKPVYNDHPWNPEIMAVVGRCSLFRRHFSNRF
jgi:hypothetical protein